MVEWETKRLGEGVLRVKHGKSQHDIKTESGIYPILATSGEIGRTNIFIYDKPSVLIGRKGSIDKPQFMDTPFWTIDTLFYTEINEENFAKYLYYLLCTIDWNKYNEASGVPSLSAKVIEDIEVKLPPLPEQKVIAAALSDMDSYIVALERLITKKRNIKKGAMQELLTGKRRLPGFSGEWVEMKVSDFGEVITGSTPSTNVAEYWGGSIPWVTPTDITTIKDISYTERLITEKGLSVIRELPANTLLVTCIASIGKNVILKKTGASNQQINAIVPNSENDVDYLYYLLELNKNYFLDKAGQTATKILSKTDFSDLTFIVPQKTEQSTIAKILSDMDVEIDALTAKLNKVRSIKQGMMQELLTGNIRLPVEETKSKTKIIEFPKQEPQFAVAAQKDGHNQQFDDAVMIAGIVNALYSDKYPLGRKKVQKCLYLLRRYQDESTKAFKKKAAGPYADEVRYKGGEPIALKNGYIVTQKSSKGTIFAVGTKINQALDYIKKWGKQSAIQWVSVNLKYRKVDDLELLATVDMAICDLEEVGITVSVATIKHLIAMNAEWKTKLKKQTFSDANIAEAIKDLQTLL